ncbi:alkaline phytoceramidase family protein [Phycomyces nitens]|nr:alkaline phytoceramidase family protein [Phycomyces nitens]
MANRDGYWGPITSSVDWCEENYVHSYYIAEFWNTVSSFAMIIMGLLGFSLHYNYLELRISASYLFIVLVGVGSVLFHGTLQFEYQMWDEIPMVWTASYLLWVLLYNQGYKRSYGFIGLYCGLATYLTSQFKGSVQFYLFQTSFGVVMWSCFWLVWKLYKGVQNKQVSRLFRQGTQYLVLSVLVWLFDTNLCFVFDSLPNPQLHAWWHVLMSVSLYLFFVGVSYESMKPEKPVIGYCWGIPFVTRK